MRCLSCVIELAAFVVTIVIHTTTFWFIGFTFLVAILKVFHSKTWETMSCEGLAQACLNLTTSVNFSRDSNGRGYSEDN